MAPLDGAVVIENGLMGCQEIARLSTRTQNFIETVPIEMRSKSTRLFIEGGEKLGIPFHSMRRNTNGCNGCGRCNFGCPHLAKMSVDRWLRTASPRSR